jgi:hypothetical protein
MAIDGGIASCLKELVDECLDIFMLGGFGKQWLKPRGIAKWGDR